MDADRLRKVETIQEFFKIDPQGELKEGTRILLEAMVEVNIKKGDDVVTFGAECDDGMYIILSGTTDVFDNKGKVINTLSVGDFIGELGLINDDKRGATVRAATDVTCANISKALFEEIAGRNRKIYGTFMNMLYTKTTKLITEQARIKSELNVATRIQAECLEDDFTPFNKLDAVKIYADMRPAKEVGGDFYDIFMIDNDHLCFLIADVSGKGVPAAIFMSMAKTHIKNYATLGLPLAEVAERANNQLCYKNETGMFVTAFICVLDLKTDDVTFINAGHNKPFIRQANGDFKMIDTKVNLVFGMMEDVPYKEQHFKMSEGDSIYMYTDGVTEALNRKQEFFGDDRLEQVLNSHISDVYDTKKFVETMYNEVDLFADGEMQADDITMVYLSRK